MTGLIERLGDAVAAWNRGDLDSYLTLYDPDIRLYGYAPEPMDKAALTAFCRMLCAALSAEGQSAPRLEFFDPICEGRWVAVHFRLQGAHRGVFLGVPPSGRPFSITGVTMLRFALEAPHVVERHSAADLLGLMIQIGAVPPPG